jgi:hypothetical protein
MQIVDFCEYWHSAALRNIRIIEDEFSNLDEQQLNITVHIHSCSIKELMSNLTIINDRFFTLIQKAIKKSGTYYKAYKPGRLCSPFTGPFKPDMCKKLPRVFMENEQVFILLRHQQEELNKLISQAMTSDLNRKVIPFALLGILKFSIGDGFQYLLNYQDHHIIRARRILMIQ